MKASENITVEIMLEIIDFCDNRQMFQLCKILITSPETAIIELVRSMMTA